MLNWINWPTKPLVSKETMLVLGVTGLIWLCSRTRQQRLVRQRKRYTNHIETPQKHIILVETLNQCDRMVELLRIHSTVYRVISFSYQTTDDRLALLQFATVDGLCMLFHVSTLKKIPYSILDLLNDDTIMKVSIDPLDVQDKFKLEIQSSVDLRFMADMLGLTNKDLPSLAKKYTNIELNTSSWLMRNCRWSVKVLSEEQVYHASDIAISIIEIFKKFSDCIVRKYTPTGNEPFWNFLQIDFEKLRIFLEPIYDTKYVESHFEAIYLQGIIHLFVAEGKIRCCTLHVAAVKNINGKMALICQRCGAQAKALNQSHGHLFDPTAKLLNITNFKLDYDKGNYDVI